MRLDAKKLTTPFPLRPVYGSNHRRPRRHLGMEPEPRESHTMYAIHVLTADSDADLRPTVEFFVGIGDINSAFLPKQQPIAPATPGPSTPDAPLASTSTAIIPDATAPFATTSTSPTPSEEELAEIEQSEILSRNADELDAQLEERPLAKKQEELQEAEEAEEAEEAAQAANSSEAAADAVQTDAPVNGVESSRTPSPTREKHKRKALLKNSDRELVRIQRVSTYLVSQAGTHSILFRFWKKYIGSIIRLTTRDRQKKSLQRKSQNVQSSLRRRLTSGYAS